MTIQLYSLELEVRALRAITDGLPEISNAFMANLDVSHFSRCAACFRRVQAFVKAGKPIPTSVTLAEDTVLDEDSRDLFCGEIDPVLDHEVEAVIDSLTRYRNVRLLHNAFVEASASLQTVQIEEAVSTVEKALMQVKTTKDDCMHHFGEGSNVEKIIDNILTDKEPDLIKTGWTEFDTRSGGWRRGNLIILAAAPASGKSVASLQLAINQYRMGHNVCLLSLEMDEEECTERLLSNISGLEYSKIRLHSLSLNQRSKLLTAYREFEDLGAARKNRLSILTPKQGTSMSSLIAMIKPMGYDIVYVDYLNLLNDIDDEKQWLGLANACREAKIAANDLNLVMVLLTQFDADKQKIRYSGGIKEHANYVWTWARTEETIKTRLIDVNQEKARNSTPFTFTLQEDFEHMALQSYTLTPEQQAMSAALAHGKADLASIPKTGGKGKGKGKEKEEKKFKYNFD
jgi:archaellum biogenesis ATPase FlaH